MMANKKEVASVTNERAALRYADKGYRVLAVWPLEQGRCTCPKSAMCKTPGKHPIANAWQKSATTDTEEIKRIFRKHPNAHVGVMPREGDCIIDVDPRNGGNETMKRLLGKSKLPPTVVQHSGGNGLHLFFKGAPNGKLGDGIDVKREGRGFVVAWPSAHVSGGSYKWRDASAPWDIEPAELPMSLAGERTTASEFDEVGDTSGVYVGDVPPPLVPIETIREALAVLNADDYTRWINVGQALKHTYGDEGLELWETWSRTSDSYQDGDCNKWETFDQNRDRPLLTIRSVLALAKREGYRPLCKEFEQTLWATGDIRPFTNTKPEPLDWIAKPCLAAGKVTVLSGAGGSSKSFLVLTLALHLAMGEDFGPFKSLEACKALLLVAEEDRSDIHRRIWEIKQSLVFTSEQIEMWNQNVAIVSTHGKDMRLLEYDESGNVQETKQADYIIEEILATGGVRLLVIDPLVQFNGANENDNGEMAMLMATLARIAHRTGCAVLVAHHTNKAAGATAVGEATQAAVRGASAIVDNARAAMLLTRMPKRDAPLYGLTAEQAGRYVVCTFVKSNIGPHTDDAIFAVEKNGVLRYAPEVTKVHMSVSQANKVQEQHRIPLHILRVLDEHPDWTQREIGHALNRTASVINKFSKELELDGLLKRTGVGAGTSYLVTNKGRETLKGNPAVGSAMQDDLKDLLG